MEERVKALYALDPLQRARILRLGQSLGVLDDLPEEAGELPAVTQAEVAPQVIAPERLELRLRQLVQGAAPWSVIQDTAYLLYAHYRSPDIAARCVELAVLNGTDAEALTAAMRMAKESSSFYFAMQPELRRHLCLKLWLAKRHEVLKSIIAIGQRQHELFPLERLYGFWMLYSSHETLEALTYFEKNETELHDAVMHFGDELGLSPGRFHWAVGKLALDSDHDVLGRRVLEKIGMQEPEYQQALQLLLRLKVDRDENGLCIFGRRLAKEKDWRRRISLLYEFFADARRLGGLHDPNRPALNDLLKTPLAWVPPVPDAWNALSQLIADHADLAALLPHLFTCFEDNATRFHPETLEQALWLPVIKMGSTDELRDVYWQGVGYIHRYLWEGPGHEANLWEAIERVQRAKDGWERPLPVDWRTLHRAAVAWLAKTNQVNEETRTVMLRQLRVAVEPTTLTLSDIKEYVEGAFHTPYGVLARLEAILRDKGLKELELRVISKKAAGSHFVNDDLARLWHLSCLMQNHDLGWRVATVLMNRGTLAPQARHAWAISGEKRNEYSLVPMTLDHMSSLAPCATPDEERFVRALLKVGPQLPELLALLDAHARVIKTPAPVSGSLESNVDKMLDRMNWLGKPKHMYRYSFDGLAGDALQVPLFQQVLPHNTWSLVVVRLSHRLGISAWNWNLEKLRERVESLIPRIVQGGSGRPSARVGKWLRALSPDQRVAWSDLATLAGKLSAERAFVLCGMLVTRGATAIYQNHHQALATLKDMRAPVSLMWGLENWLLSSEYGALRQQLATANRVPLPAALQRMASIVG